PSPPPLPRRAIRTRKMQCSSTSLSLYLGPRPHSTSPLSLHDALPISSSSWRLTFTQAIFRTTPRAVGPTAATRTTRTRRSSPPPDRKSTRLNSSHVSTSYAVFCLKKKTQRLPYLNSTCCYLPC